MDVLLEAPALGMLALEEVEEEQQQQRLEGDTQITRFFHGKVVLVTGGTGSLGKLLVTKLLHSCPGIAKVILLMRPKYLNPISHRLHHLFEEMSFERLRNNELLAKIHIVRGDLSMPRVGLDDDDVRLLAEEVDVVFHLGGTSLFERGHLRSGTDVNVRALRDLLAVAKGFRKLVAFVHVSTLFANCHKNILEEKFEEPLVKSAALVDFVAALNSNCRSSKLINLGAWRNNYLFTKSVAEEAIQSQSGHLPVVIVRLPLIISSARFPAYGFTDNINSLAGLTLTTYLGLNKSVLAKKNGLAEIFPADLAVNVLIAAAWRTARSKSLNCNVEVPKSEEKVPIYNVTSSKSNALTWGMFLELTTKHSYLHPTKFTLSLPWHFVHANKRLHFLLITLLHYIPGYFSDFISLYLTHKTKYIGYYSKIDMLSRTYSYFMLNTWDVRVDNLRALYSSMSEPDRELFDFDMTNVPWDAYVRNYIRGIRRCVLKDSDDSLAEAKMDNLKRFLRTCVSFLVLICALYALFFVQ